MSAVPCLALGGFKDGMPVVQVKSIHESSSGGLFVTIQCCYCFKEHEHGGSDGLSKSEIPDGLGHRISHCTGSTLRLNALDGYNISTVAWKLAKRRIIPFKDQKNHPGVKKTSACKK